MKVKGKITQILTVENGTSKSGKEWKSQNFIIDTGDQYNPNICFKVFGEEKTDNLTKFNKVGDEVEVEFNLSSREYEGKWYHEISAWKISKVSSEEVQTTEEEPF